ncbi:MAG: cell division ATP-binding protein FtsE [Nitrospirae bacterium]|nr:cell division ATP-binding protein FtsE [Nitrospirota bacterium]
MIMFDEVTKAYEKEHVFKNISFSIGTGELAFITGPSGAGKTTLLKLIYGAEGPDSGQIVVGDWVVSKLKQKTIPSLRQNIGVVFQDFRLLSNKTVFDNVALALSIHGRHHHEIRERVNAVLKEIKLIHKANVFPQYLSGGEQQRAVIARAMVSKPMILLADEPTGNLDPGNADVVMNLFRDINARGTTVLIATHNEGLYRGTGKRVFFINNKYIEKEYTA